MREGVYWRGNHRARHRQEDDDPVEDVPLSSRLQGRRRASKFLILCLILCFLTWIISRTLRSPLPISSERPIHPAATRGIVFELFRFYRNSQDHNRTFAAANPVHRRRRRSFLLDEDGSDSPGRHLLESATQEICDDDDDDDDEHGEQPFDGEGVGFSPLLQYDESLKKRMERQKKGKGKGKGPAKVYYGPEETSSTQEAEGQSWPLFGGARVTDLDINAFYVKIPIGYGEDLQEYFMHIDTGSGVTWVMCKGRGPITTVGPNGLFNPKRDSFMHCRKEAPLCLAFQEGTKQPCNGKNQFKCAFNHEYGDGLDVRGHVIAGDVGFEAEDGSQSNVRLAFVCADKVKDEDTKDENQETQLTDGLIGLGQHQASWLRQLNTLGLIPEDIVAICFDPAVEDRISPRPGPSLPESAGFLSFGKSYTSQAASTVWTANVPASSADGDLESDMYTARLMAIKYRTRVIPLDDGKKRKRDTGSVQGVKVGFDSGSDLTYFTKGVYDEFVQVLDNEAKSRGYQRTKDSDEFVKQERRKCWSNKGQRIPATEFGDLVLMFASLANDGTTSDLVIKPQYYIASGGTRNHRRTCFNMIRESEFDYGNLGAEVMKGHLFLFNNDLNQIGWREVKSCKNLI